MRATRCALSAICRDVARSSRMVVETSLVAVDCSREPRRLLRGGRLQLRRRAPDARDGAPELLVERARDDEAGDADEEQRQEDAHQDGRLRAARAGLRRVASLPAAGRAPPGPSPPSTCGGRPSHFLPSPVTTTFSAASKPWVRRRSMVRLSSASFASMSGSASSIGAAGAGCRRSGCAARPRVFAMAADRRPGTARGRPRRP